MSEVVPMSDNATAKALESADDASASSESGASEAAGTSASGDAVSDEALELDALEGRIVDVLKSVYDPEIPVDIYELGLIYKVEIQPDRSVDIEMTLTSPACPAAGSLPPEVEFKVASIPEVTDVRLELVWDPPWTPDFMSEVAKIELNMW